MVNSHSKDSMRLAMQRLGAAFMSCNKLGMLVPSVTQWSKVICSRVVGTVSSSNAQPLNVYVVFVSQVVLTTTVLEYGSIVYAFVITPPTTFLY